MLQLSQLQPLFFWQMTRLQSDPLLLLSMLVVEHALCVMPFLAFTPLNLDVHATGETAGLRVPRAGLNQHKQPHWMCHGCLFRSARPEPQDIGGQAKEEGPVPMDKYVQLCIRIFDFSAAPNTSPQCRNVFSLSPDVSEFRLPM